MEVKSLLLIFCLCFWSRNNQTQKYEKFTQLAQQIISRSSPEILNLRSDSSLLLTCVSFRGTPNLRA